MSSRFTKKRITSENFQMQKWSRAVALIRNIEDGKNKWLARVVPGNPSRVNFVSTQRLQQESFRESIRREVAWILDLDGRRDILVSNMAQLNLEFVACLPEDESESKVAVSFFLVDIFRRAAFAKVNQDRSNRWLSSQEVCAGESVDGIEFDPRTLFLLDRAKVINPWD